MKETHKLALWIAGIVSGLMFLCAASAIGYSNRAVTLENEVPLSKATVQNQEARQRSIVVQLVQAVEEYAQYEGITMTETASLRTGGDHTAQDVMVAINAVAEAYPDLKADRLFSNLMAEMSNNETLLFQSRERYNRIVTDYRNLTQRFPGKFFLSMVGHTVQNFDLIEQEPVVVDLTDVFGR